MSATKIGGTLPTVAVLQPVLFALTIWPVLRAYVRRRRWFTIGNSVLLLTYLYMGLGGSYYILAFGDIQIASLRNAGVGAAAMAAVLIGVIAFRIGAEVPWAAGVVRRWPALPATPAWTAALRVGILGGVLIAVAIVTFEMSQGTYGYGTTVSDNAAGLHSILQYLQKIGVIALASGIYYWCEGYDLKLRDKVVCLAGLVALVAVALLNGMKEAVIEVLIFAAVPYFASGRRPKLALVLPLAIGLAVLFALNPLYRATLRNQQQGAGYGQSAAAAVATTVDAARRMGVVEAGGRRFLERVSLFGDLSAAMAQTPQLYPYREWERYPSLVLVAVVPRVVWPSKPKADDGAEFNKLYIVDNDNSRTPTTFGWAYLEDGYVGVVVLLGALGALAALLQRYALERQRRSLAGVLLFAVGFRLLFQIERDPFWTFAGLAKEIIVLVLAYVIVVRLPTVLLRPVLRPAHRPRRGLR